MQVECVDFKMPILDEPKYPVIDKAPSLTTAVKYFRFTDYLTWAALALPAFPFGYYFGKHSSELVGVELVV